MKTMHLELRNITKRFGSFTANNKISLTVEPGQIHCLLGENGAGKSTLMNVLFGLLEPDEGEILIDGEPIKFSNSGEAVRRGIGMVHQHFMLVPVFSVAENVVLGFEPTKSFGRLDLEKASDDIRRVSKEFGLEVDPDAHSYSFLTNQLQFLRRKKSIHFSKSCARSPLQENQFSLLHTN